MFSKEESKRLRQEFWTSFGKSFPRKWILYDTKIKGLSLKFYFGTKKALVALDLELNDLEKHIHIWDKLRALAPLIKSEYLPEATFEDAYLLENGKEISRIFVVLEGVSIHDKNSWQETMLFLRSKMNALEMFFTDYREIIAS